jgi:hypothetical protein
MMNLNKREILLENFINDTTLLVENEALKKNIEIIKKDFFDILEQKKEVAKVGSKFVIRDIC